MFFGYSDSVWFRLILVCSLALNTACIYAQTAEVAADLQRGQAALKANDQSTATQEFLAALKLDPSNAEAHANLGVIAFFRGDCTHAEDHFRSALTVVPTLIRVQALLSICERRLSQPAAQGDMESAFAKLDDAKLRTQVGIELADVYYQQGELEKTVSLLHELLNLNPDNVDILFFAQRVYSELADNTLNKLAILAPSSARMEQLIAERLINAGDLKDAADHYKRALQINPKLPGMHYELAETLMETSPNDPNVQAEAVRDLNAAIESDGDSSRVECELGNIALLQARSDEALTHYKRASDLNPKDSQAQIGLAALAEMQDKHEESAAYLRMAIATDPFNAEAHYKLAQVDKELHLDGERASEMKLFLEIRAAREKVKGLYKEMNPRAYEQEQSSPQPK